MSELTISQMTSMIVMLKWTTMMKILGLAETILMATTKNLTIAIQVHLKLPDWV